MHAEQRIIVALDVPSLKEAAPLVEQLNPYVDCFKVGLELLTAVGAPRAVNFVHALGGRVFLDGKFMDIPNTVAGAVRAATRMGVEMFNIHCLGGSEMMKAAREVAGKEALSGANSGLINSRPTILGVTILTSLSYNDLVELGIETRLNIADPQELKDKSEQIMQLTVCHLARLAEERGLDGVIASPHEVEAIRKYCEPEFMVVTPGVRPKWAVAHDQKRVMTPAEAIRAGADMLVIGRPITEPPEEIGSPVDAVQRILGEIASVS